MCTRCSKYQMSLPKSFCIFMFRFFCLHPSKPMFYVVLDIRECVECLSMTNDGLLRSSKVDCVCFSSTNLHWFYFSCIFIGFVAFCCYSVRFFLKSDISHSFLWCFGFNTPWSRCYFMKAFADMNAVPFDSGFISIIFFVDVFLSMSMARLFPGYFLTTEDLHLGMSPA